MNGLNLSRMKIMCCLLVGAALGPLGGCAGDRCIGDCDAVAGSGTDTEAAQSQTGDAPEGSASSGETTNGGTAGTDESGTSGGVDFGPPNELPAGVFVPVPNMVALPMGAVADFNDDGIVEMLAMNRTSSMTVDLRYDLYSLIPDLSGLDVVRGVVSDITGVADVFAMRTQPGPDIHAARIETGYNDSQAVGLGVIWRGVEDGPFFEIDGRPLGGGSDIDRDAWAESTWLVDESIRIYEANSAPSFSEIARFDAPCEDLEVFFGDVDGDGDGDAVVVDVCDTPSATVMLNDEGSFSAAGTYELQCERPLVCLADADNDGHLDVFSACLGTGVEILRGDGAGGLGSGTMFDDAASYLHPVCGDFDGDGDIEPMLNRSVPEGTNDPGGAVLVTLVDGELVQAVEEQWFNVLAAADVNADGCDDIGGLALLGDPATVGYFIRVSGCG